MRIHIRLYIFLFLLFHSSSVISFFFSVDAYEYAFAQTADRHEQLLFSTGLELQSSLDSESVSGDLRNEFRAEGFPLSQEATVSVLEEGSSWLIASNGVPYTIRKTEDRLNIYEDERYGGEICYGELKKSSSTYDPIHNSTSLARRVSAMVFDALIAFGSGNEPLPRLTTLSKDELKALASVSDIVYTFPLRRDIQWHDGTPFTAYDVLFTYLAMRNDPKTLSQVEFIKNAKAVDKHTIQFTLNDPVLNALGKLAFPIVPYHPFISDTSDLHPDNPECHLPKTHRYTARPIGTGPYLFEPKAQAGDKIRFLVNPNYPALGKERSRGYLDSILMREFSTEPAVSGALAFGAIDVAVELPPNSLPTVIQNARQAGRSLWEERYQSLSYYFFALNHQHPFLGGDENRGIRQAILYATNRQKWINDIESGAGILISGPFPHDSPYANARVKPYPYDVSRAKELLRNAGFADTDGDGVLEKDGKKFELIMKQKPGHQKQANICEAFRHDLQAVGIRVIIQEPKSEADWEQQIYYNHDFDVALCGWAFAQATGVYSLFHASQSFPGGKNFVSYNNFSVNIIIEEAARTLDPKNLETILKDLHQVLARECTYVFLWTPLRIAAGDTKIRNHVIHPDSFFSYITEWWLNE